MAKDLLERHLPRQRDTEQDHSRDPEEQDVPTGLEHLRRVEPFEVRRLAGPALDGERPETRREPGVQDIVILSDCKRLAVGLFRSLLHGLFFGPADDPVLVISLVCRLTVNRDQVGRASVSPPKLPGNTPILRIRQPPGPLVCRALGQDLEFARGRSSERFRRGILEIDPPLGLHDGLDDITRLATDRDLHRVILGLDVQALFLEGFQDGGSDVEPLHALESFTGIVIVRSVVVHQVDEFQVVPLAAFVIVVVVRRGDLDGTGTKGHVDGDRVADDGDPSVNEGVFGELAVEMLQAKCQL